MDDKKGLFKKIKACKKQAFDDDLSQDNIKKYISKYPNAFEIDVRKVVTSTNDVAKTLAHNGVKEGTVIISQEQTAGKGRRGKNFYSPSKSGVYMSLVLRPKCEIEQSLLITVLAAVAVSRVIENVSGENVKIKWVNDVFCNDKKVCGILTESSLNAENNGVDFIVLGIGINIQEPKGGFPTELEGVATSIFKEKSVSFDITNKIVAQVLEEIWSLYLNFDKNSFLQEYKDRSFLIGRKVEIISLEKTQIATVLEIDDECRLKVKLENDEIKILSSREVSIRL